MYHKMNSIEIVLLVWRCTTKTLHNLGKWFYLHHNHVHVLYSKLSLIYAFPLISLRIDFVLSPLIIQDQVFASFNCLDLRGFKNVVTPSLLIHRKLIVLQHGYLHLCEPEQYKTNVPALSFHHN